LSALPKRCTKVTAPARCRELPSGARVAAAGRGSALHPSRRAGRTDPTVAGERNEQLVAARDGADASEAVGENAAAQGSLELGHDEAGQPAPILFNLRQERLEVHPNCLVQERLLRLAAAIARSSSDGLPSRSLLSNLRRICVGAAQGAGGFS